jgi:DNA-binding NarL/FixJ family response regulator
MKYQVCIVDDHAVVRSGLKALINSFPNTVCKWELADGSELVELVKQAVYPDIIILDITMSKLSGWQTIQQLQPYNIQKNIILLTYNSYNDNIQQFIDSDVAAFLSKDASVKEIQATIEDVIFQKNPENKQSRKFQEENSNFFNSFVMKKNTPMNRFHKLWVCILEPLTPFENHFFKNFKRNLNQVL